MRFALVNGKRQEAQKGLSGTCPGCNQLMVAKCGPIKANHWAHHGEFICDPWKENETEWHRGWKANFPDDWQEVRHLSETGVLHIADVKTDLDFVLEFQHSHLDHEERKTRQDFYKKLIWVIDAKKRKKDQEKFFNLLNKGALFKQGLPMLILKGKLEKCALIRDWAGSPAPIFFDFGDESTLWYLLPQSSINMAYVVKFSKEYFITLHRDGLKMSQELGFWFNELSKLISGNNFNPLVQVQSIQRPQFGRMSRSRRL